MRNLLIGLSFLFLACNPTTETNGENLNAYKTPAEELLSEIKKIPASQVVFQVNEGMDTLVKDTSFLPKMLEDYLLEKWDMPLFQVQKTGSEVKIQSEFLPDQIELELNDQNPDEIVRIYKSSFTESRFLEQRQELEIIRDSSLHFSFYQKISFFEPSEFKIKITWPDK